MSVLGNNLLMQYYAQNQFKYIDNPELWIEADSWGTSTWTNKGNGGYNLDIQAGLRGAVVYDALVATKTMPFIATVDRNVVGNASFTVEAIVKKDTTFNGTAGQVQYGFLASQRNNSSQQHGSWQTYFSKTAEQAFRFSFGGWNDEGSSISVALPAILTFDPNAIEYYCVGYDASKRLLWKQRNESIIVSKPFDFTCDINFFCLGTTGWPPFSAGIAAFCGSLYSIRVYQRALSEAERANNMRRDRARFNF